MTKKNIIYYYHHIVNIIKNKQREWSTPIHLRCHLRLVNHILPVDEVTSGFYQMQHLRDVASPRRQHLSNVYIYVY